MSQPVTDPLTVTAAQSLITAVDADRPPALLLLGSDAVTGVLDSRRAEIDTWRHLSTSTGLTA